MKKPNLVLAGLSAGVLLLAACSTTAPAPKTPPPAKPVAPVATAAPEPAPAPVEPPPVSAETQALVERLTEPTVGGMQHEVAEATGFPQSLASLQEGAAAPDVATPQNYNAQPPTRGLTADGATAELVERDWTGVVLVPMHAQFAKAYTSSVRITSTEAHPLTDGRVRIWTRVRNVTRTPLQVEVACTFGMQNAGGQTPPRFYALTIPNGDYRDVFFVSPTGELNTYTVLVRGGS